MNKTKRSELKFFGEPTDEISENGRYVFRYQPIDDRKHPEEVKADGDYHYLLFEVFDNTELTYEIEVGFREDRERRKFLESMRESIKRGQYASQKSKS